MTALGGPLWGTPTPAPFPLPRRADTGAGAANSTNNHGQMFPSSLFPILLYPNRSASWKVAQGGDLPPNPCSWGTLPICDECLPIQCQPHGPDPGWIQAVLPQDRIYGAGRAPEQAVLNAGDVTKAGMGRSCRARTPRGYFHPRFAFCPALTCRFALAPTVPGLCTSPGRGARGLPSSSGDSPGAAAPLGAAGVGVKAPTSRGGRGASDSNVTWEGGWLGGSQHL